MALARSSLPDQVFRSLVAGVLDGRYAPGERLPTQRALAAELGVNMASLREGIKRLEQLRLVEVRHGDAMRVTDWRANGGLDVLAYAAMAFVGPLMEARRLLLKEAAALAAERRTDAEAETLERLANEFDGDQATDLAFMATVIAAARNLVFTLIVNSMREHYLAHWDDFAQIVAGLDSQPYMEVAAAIRAGDAQRAATAMDALAAHQEEALRDRA
jgi:GntR family transcriptional repressor for pyruvate dehydrogenase complex